MGFRALQQDTQPPSGALAGPGVDCREVLTPPLPPRLTLHQNLIRYELGAEEKRTIYQPLRPQRSVGAKGQVAGTRLWGAGGSWGGEGGTRAGKKAKRLVGA